MIGIECGIADEIGNATTQRHRSDLYRWFSFKPEVNFCAQMFLVVDNVGDHRTNVGTICFFAGIAARECQIVFQHVGHVVDIGTQIGDRFVVAHHRQLKFEPGQNCT